MKKESIQTIVADVTKEYLYSISSSANHNHFENNIKTSERATYYKHSGFGVLNDHTPNNHIVSEERFLEGCTRVFLINPFLKRMFDNLEIKNVWRFNDTFANFNISNREYELANFIECIAVIDNQNVGIRYTKNTYASEETMIMERDAAYLYKKIAIPGFEEIDTIDKLWAVDWSGISSEELNRINRSFSDLKSSMVEFTAKDFFLKFLSDEEYTFFITSMKNAVSQAKEIIALSATPQLLPNNILSFKETVIEDFSEKCIQDLKYDFDGTDDPFQMSENDINNIKEAFYVQNYKDSIIGTDDFAKSFITSEYLYQSIKEGLSIDYTAVVVGYIKSVEQLLYKLYISAFEGKNKMEYWDRCTRENEFDASNPQKYRFDPYNSEWKQCKYCHKKKTDDKAPEIGELIRFVRYYDKMWNVSEEGKEYIFRCLDDFRSNCRNSHFHKDNINYDQYKVVERIRNNTKVCLLYLLGGMKLLDNRIPVEGQLNVVDYRFEKFYQVVRQKRRKLFWAEFANGYNGIIYYLNDDKGIVYDPSGILANAELRFLKLGGIAPNELTYQKAQLYFEDEEYLKNNTIIVTRNSMPRSLNSLMFARTSRSES